MHKKKKRKNLTLIEMLVVIFLISIIASLVSYKIKDSLDYGRAFKTQQSKLQLQQVLDFSLQDYSVSQLRESWQEVALKSWFGNGKNDITKDGWKRTFVVTFTGEDEDNVEVHISSPRYEAYRQKYPMYFQESS